LRNWQLRFYTLLGSAAVQPGTFISTKYVIPAYIQSYPDRPCIVLGYLDVTTRRRGEPVAFAAQRAKELGADAIIVKEQGQEYAAP